MFYRVEEVAQKRGVTMAQIAVAWILSKEGVTAPVVGTTNLNNLKDIIGAYRSANVGVSCDWLIFPA